MYIDNIEATSLIGRVQDSQDRAIAAQGPRARHAREAASRQLGSVQERFYDRHWRTAAAFHPMQIDGRLLYKQTAVRIFP